MEILLLVLKIMGIVLLSVLGIVLILLLYVLLFPILYKGNFTADRIGEEQDFRGYVKVRILGFVRIYAKLDENGMSAVMKFLWIKKALYGEVSENDAGVEKQCDATLKEDGSGAGKESEKVSGGEKEIKLNMESSELFEDEVNKEKEELKSESEASGKKKRKGFFERMQSKIENIVEELSRLSDLFDEEKNAVELFLKRKSTKYTIDRLKIKIPKLLKHILPRSLTGNLFAGFDDPSKTGYLCAVMGILYGIYGGNFEFEADFEEERLEGDVTFSGNIIPVYPIFNILSLHFSKKVRLCIKNLKVLRDETLKRVDKARETMIN